MEASPKLVEVEVAAGVTVSAVWRDAADPADIGVKWFVAFSSKGGSLLEQHEIDVAHAAALLLAKR